MQYNYEKPDNLVDLLEESVAKYANNRMYGTKNPAGEYEWVTYADVGRRVDHLRGGLKLLGVEKDDAVGYIGGNCAEWVVCAFATYGRGGRFIPMYESELSKTWEYILTNGEVKVLFVASPAVYETVKGFLQEIPTLERIITLYGSGKDTLAGQEKIGAENPVPSVHPSPNDIAGLIYTSGTTGEPKGVLLSHGNFTHNARGGLRRWPDLTESSVSISILPWAHAMGQTGELYNFIQFGGSIGFMESIQTLSEDIAKVRPTNLVAVPRVFNKIYTGLWAKMNEEGGLAKKLFVMGVEAGKERRRLAETGKKSLLVNLKFSLADKIVFSKIREKLGGRINMALTASATMNPDITKFFEDIGIPIFDCYGLTETSPCVTMSYRGHMKYGSVGKPLEGIRIEIDKTLGDPERDDGEIIVHGPCVMQGFYKKPEETRAVMTEDGGFKTGDRGRLDADGFLFITGRIKEQYKLENGKYVFPSTMEEDIKLHPLVANAIIYGDGREYNVCLLVLDLEALAKLGDPDQVFNDTELRREIQTQVTESLRGRYGNYEIPQKFGFLKEDCSVEAGTMTQTMKIKRGVVYAQYRDLIDRLYQE